MKENKSWPYRPITKIEAVHQGCCGLLQEATIIVQATRNQSFFVRDFNYGLKRFWHSRALQTLRCIGNSLHPLRFSLQWCEEGQVL